MPVIRISEELYETIGKLGYGHENIEKILWRILKYTDVARLVGDLTRDRTISIEPPVTNRVGKETMRKNEIYKLPTGIKLRHRFRDGRIVEAVVKDNYVLYDGRKYSSLSQAGIAATGYYVNGWRFWEYYDEDTGEWRKVDELRKGK